jgi:hypothetical protein
METLQEKGDDTSTNTRADTIMKLGVRLLFILFIMDCIFLMIWLFDESGYDKSTLMGLFYDIFQLLIPFELGLGVSILSKKINFKPFAAAAVAPTMLVLLFFVIMPTFVFLMIMISPITNAVLLGIIGIFIGEKIKKHNSISTAKIFFIWLFLSFFINVIAMIFVILMANNCDRISDTEKKDLCYRDKASRIKEENICENVNDLEYQSFCYMEVLFDSEYENAKSTGQCDKIKDIDSKKDCYIYVARATLDDTICQNFEDFKFMRDYKIGVQTNRCRNIRSPKKTAECEAILNKMKSDQKEETSSQTVQESNVKVNDSYSKYRELYLEEEKNGDTAHAKSRRFSEIDAIKKNVASMQKYVLECDRKGEKIKSTVNGMGSVCSSSSWAVLMDVCGEKQVDTNWIVDYDDDNNWSYTLSCKKHPECSGMENVKCTSSGCVFSEKCNL